jgi:hypothetical protein
MKVDGWTEGRTNGVHRMPSLLSLRVPGTGLIKIVNSLNSFSLPLRSKGELLYYPRRRRRRLWTPRFKFAFKVCV